MVLRAVHNPFNFPCFAKCNGPSSSNTNQWPPFTSFTRPTFKQVHVQPILCMYMKILDSTFAPFANTWKLQRKKKTI